MEKCRILIVEDEIIVSLHIRSVLLHFKYQVVEIASSGEEAIEKAGMHRPDLVLMDIHLGGRVDGIMAAACIREKYDIPTIYLTSYNDEETINKAKMTEPLGFLVKPLDNNELRNSIELALYKHESEKKLKESEERYKALFDRSLDLIYLNDFNGLLLDANNTMLNLLGYNLNEIKKLNITDILATNQISSVKNLINEIKNNNSQRNPIEYQLYSKTGKVIFVEALTSLIYKGKVPFAIQVLARDITERKRAEEDLRLSRQKYRDLFEFAPMGIYRSDAIGNILTANIALVKILGYSTVNEIRGLNIFTDICFKSDMGSKHEQVFFQTGEGTDIEIQWRMKNNTPTWVQLNVHGVKNVLGENLSFEGFVQDINLRKKAEGILIEQEKSYRSLIESSIDAIYVLQGRRLVLVNEAWQKLFGYSSDEAFSNEFDIMKIIAPRDSINIMNRFITYENQSKPALLSSRYEMIGLSKSGKEIYLEVSASEIIWKGKPAVQGIYRDITERKKAEEHLIKAKNDAEKSDRLKTEFLAQMSHEIRTPLNNILTYTSILKDEFEDKLPSGLETAFTVINSSSQRLVRTIELILNLSRIQTGNFDLNLKEFDLNKDLLEDLSYEFYSRAKVKNIALSYQNKAEKTRILADHYSTEQIFLNIIDNAIKYTSKGEIKIEITNRKANDVCVSISDTGIGISPEFLPNLFNPFSQEDMSMTRHFEGTGLGLALVKKYVEINNAVIKVESEKGKGSKFMLIFNSVN
jgi:PAS domain S-box-containing protein